MHHKAVDMIWHVGPLHKALTHVLWNLCSVRLFLDVSLIDILVIDPAFSKVKYTLSIL